jgi:gas vesicle protein
MRGLGIFITGALAGGLAGLLLAPRTGKKTRQMIRKEMDHTVKDWEKKMDKTSKEIREEYNKQVASFTQVLPCLDK